MVDSVKPAPRRYDNRNRQEHARQTRRRVVDAARLLFARDGYAATTIRALATESGVAVQTVYAVFGSKLAVLKQLFDTSIGGDDQAIRMVERPDWRAWEAEPDAVALVRAFARVSQQVCERTADVVQIMAAASGSHPEIARLWERAEAARYDDQRRLSDLLANRGQLRDGVSRVQAADIVWTLAGPGPYTDLVRRRGWSGAGYEAWLSGQLQAALLVSEPEQADPHRS